MHTLVLHPDEFIGPVKWLHGVNNGPVTFGGFMDVSEYYEEASIPSVRIHDSNWPHPREIDVPQIFRNWEADPGDPASYEFRPTDAYLDSIKNAGVKQIVYRLGTSIEHTAIKYFTHPPPDFAKWAEICCGIIRHCNEGWAGGRQFGITHWEIWNEPDAGEPMWSGPLDQYLELYAVAAPVIKAFDPTLNIGGPAVARPKTDFLSKFVHFCEERRLPLDFLSWHTYTDTAEQIASNARMARNALDAAGFSKTESHLNEWNLIESAGWPLLGRGIRHACRDAFLRQRNEIGAGFAASVLIRMQTEPIDMMNYYDAQPHSLWCGLFDQFGVPQKTFRVFQAFGMLKKTPERLSLDSDDEIPGIAGLAAGSPDGRSLTVLLAREAREGETVVQLRLAGPKTYECSGFQVVDRSHDFAAFPPPAGENSTWRISLRGPGFVRLSFLAC
jgi:xylan 1,4-beta-xylosidase